VPTLRQRLKQPGTYLTLLAITVALASADTYRPPSDQLMARAYVAVVVVYQRVGRPILGGLVQCRYLPTCSRYSIEAVQKFGFRKGIVLTAERLWRCRSSVALGTADPVPNRTR
jgi:putative membrane protein insertion efficiency factor